MFPLKRLLAQHCLQVGKDEYACERKRAGTSDKHTHNMQSRSRLNTSTNIEIQMPCKTDAAARREGSGWILMTVPDSWFGSTCAHVRCLSSAVRRSLCRLSRHVNRRLIASLQRSTS
jgi:hypothetical protein